MRYQWSIRCLMALVVVVAIGLAALHRPSFAWASALFTLAVVLPLGAVLAALSCKGSARLPWIGFALFGFFFLNASFNWGRQPLGPSGMAPTPEQDGGTGCRGESRESGKRLG